MIFQQVGLITQCFIPHEGALLSKNPSFSSHKAVISAFGKEFIKSKKLPLILHHNLRIAFRLRQAGDYGGVTAAGKEEAKRLIAQAKEFVNAIEEYLRKEGYSL